MPECRHFGACGSCTLQHLAPADYAAHKLALLTNALARHKVTAASLRPLVVVPPATRRRIEVVATRQKLGFHEKGSRKIITISECTVARPELVNLLPALRKALTSWLQEAETLDIMLTLYSSGIDMLVTGPAPKLAARQDMADFAASQKLPRLSWRANLREAPEPLALYTEPTIQLGQVCVAPPAGAFLQPTAEGEAMLGTAVLRGVGEAAKVADLFSGMGTFGLRLASSPTFYEGDKAAHNANPAPKKYQRDLFRDPLTVAELNFDAVILDPPRQGAAAQCRELAQSQVPRIIYVSCNPDTFSRDAATLMNKYQLDWIQPVDQFLWSEHLELVALFSLRPTS